jgi:hypothetical protein
MMFRQRRVLLCDFIHLRDRTVHLVKDAIPSAAVNASMPSFLPIANVMSKNIFPSLF